MLADLHDAGFTDLVTAHFAVLRYPGPDGSRPSDLAVGAGMTKQAMNYLLGQLEQCGYLVRSDGADPPGHSAPPTDHVVDALRDSTATRNPDSVVNGRRSHDESSRSATSPTCSTSARNSSKE